MSSLSITIGAAMDGIKPVHAAVPRAAENLASGVASAQSTITVLDASEVMKLTAVGGNVWVKVGANPTAAAGSDHYLADGAILDLGFLQPGWKVAVIDA